MKLSDLKPAGYNPRIITDEQLERLKKALHEFGDLSGIVYNRKTGNLVGGHQRLKCLPPDAVIKKEKLKKPSRTGTTATGTITIDNETYTYREVAWDETKEKAANIAANQHGGEFDDEKLALLIKEITEDDNFDTDLLGFDDTELNQCLNLAMNNGLTDPDDVPEVAKAITKTGDLYILGSHRLLCGDATKKEDVERLMDGKKGTLGFTSPPYWVGKEYETQKSVEEIDEFIDKICQSYNFAIRKDMSRIIINTSTGFTTSFDKKKKRQVLLLVDKWANNFYQLGWNLRHIRHWIKEGQLMSTSPKSDLIDQHCEFLETFEHEKGKKINFDDIIDDSNISILETYYNAAGISQGQMRTGFKWALRSYWDDIKGNASQTGHCAAFPIELAIRHIWLYTKQSSLILDLFLGSGSTLIACEKTNRICYGMEIDPHYCDVIVKRWENFTGKKAVKQ